MPNGKLKRETVENRENMHVPPMGHRKDSYINRHTYAQPHTRPKHPIVFGCISHDNTHEIHT